MQYTWYALNKDILEYEVWPSQSYLTWPRVQSSCETFEDTEIKNKVE
jgi:hypothetical protein